MLSKNNDKDSKKKDDADDNKEAIVQEEDMVHPVAQSNVVIQQAGTSLDDGAPSQRTQNMTRAYKVSSRLFQAKAKEVLSKEELELLTSKIKRTDIIVVTGSYDHGELIFRAMNLPHLVISPHQLSSIELTSDQILFINCPGSEISQDAHPKVKRFVSWGTAVHLIPLLRCVPTSTPISQGCLSSLFCFVQEVRDWDSLRTLLDLHRDVVFLFFLAKRRTFSKWGHSGPSLQFA